MEQLHRLTRLDLADARGWQGKLRLQPLTRTRQLAQRLGLRHDGAARCTAILGRASEG
jgi:hypothetical protein